MVSLHKYILLVLEILLLVGMVHVMEMKHVLRVKKTAVLVPLFLLQQPQGVEELDV